MSSFNSYSQHPANKLILGLGKTGLSVARFLATQDDDVAVMDTRELPPCLAELRKIFPKIEVTTGRMDSGQLIHSSLIVLSPGIDPRSTEIIAAKNAGVEVIGDIELFARHANAPIIAITGSNGKSTVTTLLAEMLVAAGKTVKAGGNLGPPALDLLVEPAPDFYLLELSSFQLETVSSLNAVAAVVLNLSPDHLDRYDSEADYQQTKAKVFSGNGIMVINADDKAVLALVDGSRRQIYFGLEINQGNDFGLIEHNGTNYLAQGKKPLLAIDELKIVGRHNIANALAALALGNAIGVSIDSMLIGLRDYAGLPHRCNLVTERDGVKWFNDSKATNVGACLAAIKGLADSGPIILIAGGIAKDQDFSPLGEQLKNSVRALILVGQDADQIAKVIPEELQSFLAQDMDDAVGLAAGIAQPGDSVLLSPACASFDMFSSYIARGEAFEQAVLEWAA